MTSIYSFVFYLFLSGALSFGFSLWGKKIFCAWLVSKEGLLNKNESSGDSLPVSSLGNFLERMNLPSIKMTFSDSILLCFFVSICFLLPSAYFKIFDFLCGGEELSEKLIGVKNFSGLIFFHLVCIVAFFAYKKLADGKFLLNLREISFSSAILYGAKALFAWLPLVMFFNVLFLISYFLIYGELPLKQEIVGMVAETFDDALQMTLAFIAVVVLAPIFEELFFRGLVYRLLKGFFEGKYFFLSLRNPQIPTVVFSVIFSSVIFASIHANLASWVALFILACVLTLAYECSKNIKVPIVMHSLFNLLNFLMMVFFAQ